MFVRKVKRVLADQTVYLISNNIGFSGSNTKLMYNLSLEMKKKWSPDQYSFHTTFKIGDFKIYVKCVDNFKYL